MLMDIRLVRSCGILCVRECYLPPTFEGMKVYNTEEKELIMELGLKWAANPNILVAAKAFGLKATVQISAPSVKMTMNPVTGLMKWKSHTEEAPSPYDHHSFTKVELLDQLNTTRDNTDYLWYMTDLKFGSKEGFLKVGKLPVLMVESAGDGLHVFINGQLSGTAYGGPDHPKLTFNQAVNLRVGVNKISLLSVSVGLPNIGPHFQTRLHGVHGVLLDGLNEGKRDLTRHKLTYKVLDLQVFACPCTTLNPLVPSFPCFANIYVSLMGKVRVSTGGSSLLAIHMFLEYK